MLAALMFTILYLPLAHLSKSTDLSGRLFFYPLLLRYYKRLFCRKKAYESFIQKPGEAFWSIVFVQPIPAFLSNALCIEHAMQAQL
jgi:hypothetical protein